MKSIRVLSLDYDGCLATSEKFEALEEKDPIKALFQLNQDLLRKFSVEDSAVDKTIVMQGSNRQSYCIDALNTDSHKTGSSFAALNVIAAEINKTRSCAVDGLLLADILGNLANGLSFKKALEEKGNTEVHSFDYSGHANSGFDDTKFSLLYVQMHKIASENPKSQISFDFYDDKEQMLRELAEIYTDNSDLLPANVVLHLYHYDGKLKMVHSVGGAGEIDANYKASYKEMQKMKLTMLGVVSLKLGLDDFKAFRGVEEEEDLGQDWAEQQSSSPYIPRQSSLGAYNLWNRGTTIRPMRLRDEDKNDNSDVYGCLRRLLGR